jgi:hypothetical protein
MGLSTFHINMDAREKQLKNGIKTGNVLVAGHKAAVCCCGISIFR